MEGLCRVFRSHPIHVQPRRSWGLVLALLSTLRAWLRSYEAMKVDFNAQQLQAWGQAEMSGMPPPPTCRRMLRGTAVGRQG